VHKWQRDNCAATPPHKTSNLLALAVLFIIVLLIDACPLTYICEQTNEIIESKYNCFLEYLFLVKIMGGEYINVIFSEAESPKLDRLIVFTKVYDFIASIGKLKILSILRYLLKKIQYNKI
jgi:hypothetical protein